MSFTVVRYLHGVLDPWALLSAYAPFDLGHITTIKFTFHYIPCLTTGGQGALARRDPGFTTRHRRAAGGLAGDR